MEQIRRWLEAGGHDYAQGLALYEAHGRSRVVLTALRRGQSDFTRQKLREELTRLSQAAPAPAAPVPAVVPAPQARPAAPKATPRPKAGPVPKATSADVPETVRAQRSSWFAERHRLHATLELVLTDEERRVQGERILLLSEWITASYQRPDAEPAPPAPGLASLRDVGEIRRQLANLRARASKLKNNPARALDLQQVRADIDLLERKLVKP